MEVKFLSKMSGFHFASSGPNFIGFRIKSNLSLVEFLEVIQYPTFHWIWTKPHQKLGNVSDMKTTHMKSYENLQGLSLFYVSNIYRWDVKRSATHLKGSQNITFGANIKVSSLKSSQYS